MARRLIDILFIAVLAGCSPHQVKPDPLPPVKFSQRYSQAEPDARAEAKSSSRSKGERWWTAFRDPALDGLVDGAMAGNFDLKATVARVSQARAAAEIAGAPRLPSLDLGLGASVRSFNPANFGGRSAPVTAYGATGSLNAAYEVDVWAKVANGAKAAALDAAAAADMSRAMAMTVSAEVAGAYYDLVAAREQRKLLGAQQRLSESFLAVVELRFGEGLANAVDVNQQRQQVIGIRSAVQQLVATEAVAGHRLAALLGKVPGSLSLPELATLPVVPPLPETGVPSELLQRRPDLRAAQRRVEAADRRVAVAVADRYPSLRLTGSLTSQPNTLNDFLLQPVWELASGLAMPLFDHGRRAAEVERRRALMAETVADYGKAVLGAMVEVDNALVQERQQARRIVQIQEQQQVAQATLGQARDRYGEGVGDYLSVLTALRSEQDVERSLLEARRLLITHRISLYRALGGLWPETEDGANKAAEDSP